MNKVAQWLFGTAFVVSFGLAIYLLVMDQTAFATVSAVLALSMGLFCFLPTLESFTAFGLSAQFRAKINEAEELLGLLRESIRASARSQFASVAWGGRWGGEPAELKMSYLGELLEVLRKAGVSPERIIEIHKPLVDTTSFDTYRAFSDPLEKLAAKRIDELRQAIVTAEHEGKPRAEIESIEARQKLLEFFARPERTSMSSEANEARLEGDAMRIKDVDDRDFRPEEKETFERRRLDAIQAIRDCRAAGNLTPSVISFTYRRERSMVSEVLPHPEHDAGREAERRGSARHLV